LNYLHQLPIDTVKIDRSFIGPLGEADANAAIVEAVLAIARSLKLRVVAEGVTEKQLAELNARARRLARLLP
jgi:sensor c-di-GMP phosphodiesterase-like protein